VYKTCSTILYTVLDRSISATQSVSRNSEGHMESVQPIKCMLFILIFNKLELIAGLECNMISYLTETVQYDKNKRDGNKIECTFNP
jgi:hypothetical protein